jgi:hypothetical protein
MANGTPSHRRFVSPMWLYQDESPFAMPRRFHLPMASAIFVGLPVFVSVE